MNDAEFEDFKQMILTKEAEGKAVYFTSEGLAESKVEDLVKQPVDGILYDINRDRATILTLFREQKWVNDFACMLVIRELYRQLQEAKADLAAAL